MSFQIVLPIMIQIFIPVYKLKKLSHYIFKLFFSSHLGTLTSEDIFFLNSGDFEKNKNKI